MCGCGSWPMWPIGPEKWATIPENATQDLSRYTTIVVVGDRATGWRGPNRNIRSLRAAYLVATDAQDNPGGVGRPDGGRASSLRRYKQPQKAPAISAGASHFERRVERWVWLAHKPYVMYRPHLAGTTPARGALWCHDDSAYLHKGL